MFRKLTNLVALLTVATILAWAAPAQARAKVTGLVGGTGYIEVALADTAPGWTYIVWSYDMLHKVLYKSAPAQTDKATLTITVEVPVEQSQYQVLIIQLKPPAPTPTPTPEATPTPEVTPTPEAMPEVTPTPTPVAFLRVQTKSPPTFLSKVGRALEGLLGGTANAAEVPASYPAPSGIVVLDYMPPEQVSQLTLDPLSGSLVRGDGQTTVTVVDLGKAGQDPDPIQSGGNQLLPGVALSTADTAQGMMMMVDLVEVPVMSADILKSAFSADVFTSATSRFSTGELVTARRVLQSLRDEALKVYEIQLEQHRQSEYKRAREQLLNDALKPR